MEKLYRPEDVAFELGLSVKTVYNLKSQGVLKEGVHYFRMDLGAGRKGRPRYSLTAIRELFKAPAPVVHVNVAGENIVPLYPLQAKRAAKMKARAKNA